MMNKKEQAEMEALRHELRLAKALRWTDPVSRDLPPPPNESKVGTLSRGYNGWSWNNEFSVAKACSSCSSHGGGWEKTGSQRPMHLFSTRLLALRHVRNECEQRAAKTLAAIDAEIEKELANPSETWLGTTEAS